MTTTYIPRCLPRDEDDARAWRSAHPRARWIAWVETWRCYGGPEEGGWWYDRSAVVRVERCDNARRARRIARRAQRDSYRPKYDRFSVLGGTDYDVLVTHDPRKLLWWHQPHRQTYC